MKERRGNSGRANSGVRRPCGECGGEASPSADRTYDSPSSSASELSRECATLSLSDDWSVHSLADHDASEDAEADADDEKCVPACENERGSGRLRSASDIPAAGQLARGPGRRRRRRALPS